MFRSHTCGQLNIQHINQEIILCGRVDTIRNLGGMTFIDLRDRYGITQIKLDPDQCKKDLNDLVKTLKNESVIQVHGFVIKRPEGMTNQEMPTGEIEVQPTDIKLFSASGELPFPVNHDQNTNEELRLEYRYLDLRRKSMKENIVARHNITMTILDFFNKHDFLYIETPTFIKNTPEGAKEYIVPCRSHPGKFYVLPQSPQQLKQLSMVAGIDRYVQLARCYRDEPLRGDRQPEFTQIDLEMSFVEQQDVLELLEKCFMEITNQRKGTTKTILSKPFQRLTRDEAMNSYGIDKPELRTDAMKLIDCTEWGKKLELNFFNEAECIKAICVPKVYGRSEIDNKITPLAQQKGATGLAWLSFENGEMKGSIAKFVTEEMKNNLLTKISFPERGQGDFTLFFQATNRKTAVDVLGFLRNYFIKDLDLLNGKEHELAFAFVLDFPLYEIDEETDELAAAHHPFTKPKDADIPFVKEIGKKMLAGSKLTQEEKVKMTQLRADCYDLVLNGYELGSGSIRITDPELQTSVFAILGATQEQITARFGHMIKAFQYGVPPHGGFAFGLDRVVMLYQNMPNIREVIPFPKNQQGVDVMLNAPSEVEERTLNEVGIQIRTT